ncbi:MAG: SAM-dependent methyltransferase [Solirubrobacterales bacterium]|nr:MAG: SAM-dependent methyltransferase [Solirubrobacterales bacterium]
MTGPSATALFSRYARDYDASRRRLIPAFDDFYGAVVDTLSLGPGPIERVLDLGAGTGLLSAGILAAHPYAKLVLLDGSEEMLARAQARLGPALSELHLGDMRDCLPAGPFDAIVSALAIHHLDDGAKRDLFARALARLRPGGAFVNAEQVAGPSRSLTDVYDRVWVRQCRALGATAEELSDARERMANDDCADVDSQLRWLRKAGFAEVDCVLKSWRFAVMAAWAPAS